MLGRSIPLQHCARDRGCGAHPVFPAPSEFGGWGFRANPRALGAAGWFVLFEIWTGER